jgi:signal transduction histidine kinase
MTGVLPNFDREPRLQELLRAVPRARLEAALDGLIGGGWRIDDAGGNPGWYRGMDGSHPEAALPIRVDIDIVGYLVTASDRRQQAHLAVQWLVLVLTSARRYQMAADLHLEAVHADYAEIQAKHAALQASEDRYRKLAEELEQRVCDQVDIIERAQRQLFQSAQMAAIGSLAAGMAHEINNPIGFIRSNLSTAASYLEQMTAMLQAFRRGDVASARAAWDHADGDFVMTDFNSLLSESAAGADRIARIVARLKAYAGIDRASGPVDINQAVRAATELLCEQLPAGVTLETNLQPLPSLAVDLAQMSQALFALLQNARQALGAQGGCIRVASGVADGEIRIAIRDNGSGMDAALRARIFDPFFTTREVGGGMGLGLTVSNDIVRAHHGRIDVESAVGTGSVFTVCLPLKQPAVPQETTQ